MNYNTLAEFCQDTPLNLCMPANSQKVLQRIEERIIYRNRLLKYYKTALNDNDLLERMFMCGTLLGFDNNGKIVKANFCKNRICPVCNYRKSSNAWGKIYKVVCSHEEKYKYIFITLTVRNCEPDELNKTIDDMLNSFKRITNRKTWKNSVKGFVRGLEITFNTSQNTFHPHIHVLCAVDSDYFENSDKYIDAQTLTEWWEKSARLNYRPNTHITAVEDKKKGVAEVAKYALKMSDILKGHCIDKNRLTAMKTLYEAVRGRRLCSSAGVFKSVKLEDKDLLKEKRIEYENLYGDFEKTIKYVTFGINGFEDITFKMQNDNVFEKMKQYEKLLRRQYNITR